MLSYQNMFSDFPEGLPGLHLAALVTTCRTKMSGWDDPKTAWKNDTLWFFGLHSYRVIVMKDGSFIDDLPGNKCDSCFPKPFWITQGV